MYRPARTYKAGPKRHATGVTLIEALFIVGVIALLVVFLLPTLRKTQRSRRRGPTCGSNLKQLYTSMVQYGYDYGGFPMIPFGGVAVVGEDRSVDVMKIGAWSDPFRDLGPEDRRSVSQNLWILCRKHYATPDVFVCPASDQAGQTTPVTGPNAVDARCFVDFPWTSKRATMSYSFLQPWSTLTGAERPPTRGARMPIPALFLLPMPTMQACQTAKAKPGRVITPT